MVLMSAATRGQKNPLATRSSEVLEFPVLMRQKVEAGKTPVGSKIRAQLLFSTLVDGMVVPRDAILSGEVIESAAKSATDSSRLSIRLDSAQWKKGSAPIKVYLTAWFYPETITNQDGSNDPADAARRTRTWTGMGPYPDPNNPASQTRFPGRDSDRDNGIAPPLPSTAIPKHRVLMKDVESARDSQGAVVLTSKHSNIKIDKVTTYVLATGDLLTMK